MNRKIICEHDNFNLFHACPDCAKEEEVNGVEVAKRTAWEGGYLQGLSDAAKEILNLDDKMQTATGLGAARRKIEKMYQDFLKRDLK